jgi:hypothetical protein
VVEPRILGVPGRALGLEALPDAVHHPLDFAEAALADQRLTSGVGVGGIGFPKRKLEVQRVREGAAALNDALALLG